MFQDIFEKINIFTILLLAIIIVGCDDNPAKPNINVNADIVKIEGEVLRLINSHRTAKGLTALVTKDIITQQCRIHSNNMAVGLRSFGHDGFENERLTAISSEIQYAVASENVALNKGFANPAEKAANDWLASPSHLENIEGDYDFTGIGVIKSKDDVFYFTQIFVKSM